VIYIHHNTDEDEVGEADEREAEVGQLRLRPIGDLLALIEGQERREEE